MQQRCDLGRHFRLNEAKQLQFRGEFFNIFNQVNLDRPNGNASGGSGFGRITSAPDGRSIQFGLKFYW